MTSCAKSVSDGALFELGAVGVEERYTVCDPQKSFFVQCCKRHTNFAFAQLDFNAEQHVSNLVYWPDGYTLNARMPKHGDLLLGSWLRLYLGRLTLPSGTIARQDDNGGAKDPNLLGEGDEDVQLNWCEEVAFAAIMQADWQVGNNLMDRLDGEALHMYHEQGTCEGRILRDAIGKQRSGNYVNSSYTNVSALTTFSATDRYLYAPLLFSYMKGPENAFPIVAVQHDEIRYKVELRGRANLITALDVSAGPGAEVPISKADPRAGTNTYVTGGQLIEAGFTAELAFLDKPEQESYTSSAFHKYYEYTQGYASKIVAAQDKSVTIQNLAFNHAIVKLNTFYRATAKLSAQEYFNFSTPLPNSIAPQRIDPAPAGGTDIVGLKRELNPFECIEVQYGSAPRVSRQGVYLHECVPYLRHRRIDDSFSCVYSFAMDPECGTCPTGASNIGRFSNTPMKFTFIDSYESGDEDSPSTLVRGTGIAEAGEVRVYALTQGFYKVAGGRLALRWSGP